MCPQHQQQPTVQPCPWCGAPHSSADHEPGWYFVPVCCPYTRLVWVETAEGLQLEWVPGEDD